MKVSVVISIKNRTKLFKRSLSLFQKQTMMPADFELVVVDDMSTEDVRLTLQQHATGMNVKYIRMDTNLNDFPVFWGPSLSNNVGFKAAEGEVVMITGPEILSKETNLQIGYESALKDEFVYGHVLHSGPGFVATMDRNPALANLSFDKIFNLPQARVQDITKNTFYWFACFIKRQHLLNIGGCDENYLKGIAGDDDSISLMAGAYGIPSVHNYNIIGIHQDHSVEDWNDPKRKRRSPIWEEARLLNTKYLDEWHTLREKTPYANVGRDWGSDKVVISREQIHKC